jgi:hypothetical protein
MHYLIISVFCGVTVAKKNDLRGVIDVPGIATMQLQQKEVGFFCIQNYRGLASFGPRSPPAGSKRSFNLHY